jgi:hypothetical protein
MIKQLLCTFSHRHRGKNTAASHDTPFTWLIPMVMAAPLMNPDITEWDKKLVTLPEQCRV